MEIVQNDGGLEMRAAGFILLAYLKEGAVLVRDSTQAPAWMRDEKTLVLADPTVALGRVRELFLLKEPQWYVDDVPCGRHYPSDRKVRRIRKKERLPACDLSDELEDLDDLNDMEHFYPNGRAGRIKSEGKLPDCDGDRQRYAILRSRERKRGRRVRDCFMF